MRPRRPSTVTKSQQRQRLFEVRTGAKSPFVPQKINVNASKVSRKRSYKNIPKTQFEENPKADPKGGPSGSSWGEPHLNWLHISQKYDCDLEQIFRPETELSPSSKIAKQLRDELAGEWKWICEHDHKVSSSIFGRLQALILQREEDDAFNTDTNTQPSSKYRTPPSAKSDSMTPQQYLRGLGGSLRMHDTSPTPLRTHTEILDPQLRKPEFRSRKRHLEDILSPHRERERVGIPAEQNTDHPISHRQREGSPTPRQVRPTTTGHQLHDFATEPRHVLPSNSPLTHRQWDPETPTREIKDQTTISRPIYPSKRQQSITSHENPKTSSGQVKVQTAPDGQDVPPIVQSGYQGVNELPSIQSHLPESQSPVDEEEDDEGEEEEEEEEEENSDGEYTGEEKDEEEEGDKDDEDENDEEDEEEENYEEDDDEEDEDEDEDEEDEEEEEDIDGEVNDEERGEESYKRYKAARGASEAASNDKSEKDVERAGGVFLSLIQDAINDTKKGLQAKLAAKQNVMLQTRDPRVHHIEIDKTKMSTHPDLALEITFGQKKQRRTIEVVLEFKKKDHALSAERILGQEVSELLGAVLKQMAARRQTSYTSYLISWHGLKGYISRFRATREYLRKLQENSRELQNLDPPIFKSSKPFDLTDSEQRIRFGIACARIAVEEMRQFKRSQTSDLLERVLA